MYADPMTFTEQSRNHTVSDSHRKHKALKLLLGLGMNASLQEKRIDHLHWTCAGAIIGNPNTLVL